MNPEEIPVWKPFLKRIPLFQDLKGDDLDKLAALLKPLSLPRDATLFHQGDSADSFYIITSGQVRLITERQGKENVIGYLTRGDTLGELALLTGEPRAMTVLLDTTSEFLVLAKEDFTSVLRTNPAIHFQLSRGLSTRLLQETRGLDRSPGHPRLFALVAATEAEDRRLFTLQFAHSLVEQTRQRVILVDMSSEPGSFSKAFGFDKPKIFDEKGAKETLLRDPVLLKKFVQVHASGLGILTIPPSMLGGRLFKSIFLLMNLLRENSDFVILALSGELGDVEKSVLYEADQWILVGRDGLGPEFARHQRSLNNFVPEPKSLLEVWLGSELPPELLHSQRRDWVRIEWSGALAEASARGDSPFALLERFPRSRRGIESLARRIGRLRVGLALGTGAALGYSLVGILKALDHAEIPLDVIAGTSMGSLVGGLYALGMSAEEIEAVALRVDKAWVWENLFWDLTLPRSGIFAGTTLLRFIKSYFKDKEFHELLIPYACVATDIETGEEVVFRDGPVAEAVRASCGIPLIFAPFKYKGRFLVDGGLVDPVPIGVLSHLGADLSIAVNLTVPAGERKSRLSEKRERRTAPRLDFTELKKMAVPQAFQAPNLFQIFFQMIYTMEYEIAKSRASMAHIYIHPDLSGFSWTEMHRAKELIAAGERVAETVLPKLKALLPYYSDACKIDIRSTW
ncbi:MAG: patatin-like phospholipase family protein [Elusimicrobiota bacterium]